MDWLEEQHSKAISVPANQLTLEWLHLINNDPANKSCLVKRFSKSSV